MYDQRGEAELFVNVTKTWWNEERQYFEIWASEATLYEVRDGDYPHKAQALTFASQLQLLPPTRKFLRLPKRIFKPVSYLRRDL